MLWGDLMRVNVLGVGFDNLTLEEALEKALERNDRALFSSRPMPEADWEAMLAFRGETICQLETHTKWYRRLWLKWGRCLY